MMLFRVVIVCLFSFSFTFGADPALTIYNQNFAVIREAIPLTLKAGTNSINFTGATAQVEPDSVMLRDPSGQYMRSGAELSQRSGLPGTVAEAE
jgi:hypothetical protein